MYSKPKPGGVSYVLQTQRLRDLPLALKSPEYLGITDEQNRIIGVRYMEAAVIFALSSGEKGFI